MGLRLLSLVGAFTVSLSASAEILIDDFTVGEHHVSVTGNGQELSQQVGLDTAHAIYGERGTDFLANSTDLTVNLDLAGGAATVSVPGGVTSDLITQLNFYYGVPRQIAVDFSATPEFQMDFHTQDPGGVQLGVSAMAVIDSNNRSALNLSPILRPEGMSWLQEDFDDDRVDWSSIRVIYYFGGIQGGAGLHPQTYSYTRFAAVPEPASAIVFGLGAIVVARRRPRIRHKSS